METVLILVALGLWVWYWHDWGRRHPGKGVDDVLIERTRVWMDRNKISASKILIVAGLAIFIWGLAGYNNRDRGGVWDRNERLAMAVGGMLIAGGVMAQRR